MENLVKAFVMFLLGLAMNQDIIDHADYPTQTPQGFGHSSLKVLGSTGDPKG